jgi:hypothetical protein
MKKQRRDLKSAEKTLYAHECRIRNAYASDLKLQRPHEKVLSRETRYTSTAMRADLRTVDSSGLIREWEFKINADHHALGQVLTYMAHARIELKFRPVRGVIASFVFTDELLRTVEVMNLNIELVTLASWMACGGNIPVLPTSSTPLAVIPSLNFHAKPTATNKEKQ